jgi:aminoglycoside phosphotransferase (APT) family kinase protein
MQARDIREDDATVAAELLAHLRAAGGDSTQYAAPPARLEGGLENDTYAFTVAAQAEGWPAGLVLRLFRGGSHPLRADFERCLQNELAAQGFPCPRVRLGGGGLTIDGRPFTVMERAPGADLLSTMFPPAGWTFRATPAFAETHARLHRIDAGAVIAALAELGFAREALRSLLSAPHELAGMQARGEKLDAPLVRDGLRWLHAHAPEREPPAVICHGDYHPRNVLVHAGRISAVIDWSVARVAPAEYDVGRTTVLMRHAPSTLTGVSAVLASVLRRTMLFRYLRVYSGLRPVDRTALRYFTALHLLRSLIMGYEARAHGDDAVRQAWGAPSVIRSMAAHFSSITGARTG